MSPLIIHFIVKDVLAINTIENINDRNEGHNQKIAGIIRPKLNIENKKH